MIRYVSGELTTPIVSSRKDPRPANIPPFSFIGELEIGLTGFWYPTSYMELATASVSASGPGTSALSITVLKEEPGTGRPIVIGTFSMGATETKQVISLNDALVSPYDKVYLASWADSGHLGVVVQIVGSMMT